MLRAVLAILAVLGIVAATAVTGPFWLTVLVVGAALLLGAAGLSLLPVPEEDEEGGEGDDAGADVLSIAPRAGGGSRTRVPGTAGGLGQAA
ncbi:hypothetical protein [Blastococcus litoris]|uniref:hypothetical protein n=1 Tax=Blastococcus litoris TaxID=2171622 RepID=UPI0013DF6159|nr:hypothetical protein [Blastococcus litoris]